MWFKLVKCIYVNQSVYLVPVYIAKCKMLVHCVYLLNWEYGTRYVNGQLTLWSKGSKVVGQCG